MARKQTRRPARREPVLFGESPQRAAQRKAPKRQRSWLRWFGFFFLKLALAGCLAVGLVFGFAWYSLAQKGLFVIPERAPGIMVLANDGSVLAEQGAFNGDAARIEELPDYVPNAIIAIEDRRFRSHWGVDPRGFARAMYHNFQAGRMVEGGSTLTQQLAKNLFLTPERTAWRKIQEMVLALWLERRYSKDEILQLYLNRVDFAGASLGIDAAAQKFYGVNATDLTLMQAATMAGLLKATNTYNPAINPEKSSSRAELVLNAMVEEGYITPDDETTAITTPTAVTAANYVPAKQYVVDWVNEQLPQLVKNYSQSIVVQTTLDPAIQSNAEQSLRQRLNESGKKFGVKQGAIVVMDGDGAVKAMVGGRSYKKSQYNRATKAKRQPGSSFKPFVYLAAMENGYRPDSVEVDEPIRIGTWQPDNYKHKYLGPVTLETAFAQSLNSVAAKIANQVGIAKVADVAHQLGIASPLGKDVSLALGTSEVSLLELTTAYAPFANGGEVVQPHVVTRITTRDGDVLYERVGSGLGKVVSDFDLGAMNQLLRAVVRRGTGTKAQFGNADIGGKTGTSQDYRDGWFVGFTTHLVAGVWMGNDDNSPTKAMTGGSLPTIVWHDVMATANANLPGEILPGETQAPVAVASAQDAQSGPEVQIQNDQPIVVEQLPRKKRTLFDFLFGNGRKKAQDDGLY
jgi:penicillin-binding protein 1A